MLISISYVAILACALLLAGRSYRLGEALQHTAAMTISLAAAFIACSAAADLLLTETNQDTATLKRMLNNLAFYAAIPLISSAMLDISWKFKWSKAAWGRWLLVLFALFELCRRADVGLLYSQAMAGLCVLTLLACITRLPDTLSRTALCLSTAILGVGLLAFSPTGLSPELANPLAYNICIASYLLTLVAVIKLPVLSTLPE